MRILQFRARPNRQRPGNGADVSPQIVHERFRQPRADEFRENLLIAHVGIDHIHQPVVPDELVEIVGGHDHRAGQHHFDSLVFIVEVVTLQHIVDEGQSSGLSPQRPLTDTGKPDVAVIGLRVEMRDHAVPLYDAVFGNRFGNELAEPVHRRKMALGNGFEHTRQPEQSP